MTHALPSKATNIPSVVTQAIEESMAKIIIQQNEASWISSLGQKVGQFLSCEAKPGFILIPGMDRDAGINTGAEKVSSVEKEARKLRSIKSVDDLIKIGHPSTSKICSN